MHYHIVYASNGDPRKILTSDIEAQIWQAEGAIVTWDVPENDEEYLSAKECLDS